MQNYNITRKHLVMATRIINDSVHVIALKNSIYLNSVFKIPLLTFDHTYVE